MAWKDTPKSQKTILSLMALGELEHGEQPPDLQFRSRARFGRQRGLADGEQKRDRQSRHERSFAGQACAPCVSRCATI